MLIAFKDNHYSCVGSGVIIGPLLALTARHVIEDYCDMYEGASLAELPGDGTFHLQAIHFVGGTKAANWDVQQIYCHSDAATTDLVVLRLIPVRQEQVDYIWRKLRLRLAPPDIGSVVAAFGYHSTSTIRTENAVELATNPYTSRGYVIEIHDAKLDRVMLPFPCFRVNARFDHAMSGGPVFTESGLLCGIICCSLPPDIDNPEVEPASYACSLWPIVGIFLDLNRHGGHEPEPKYPLLDLFRDGFLEAADADRVSLVLGADNSLTAIALAPEGKV